MSQPIDLGRTGLATIEGNLAEFSGQMLFGFSQIFFQVPSIEQVFQSSAAAIGAVAMFQEDADDRGCDAYAFIRRKQDAAIAGKVLMTRDPAQLHAEVNSRLDARRVICHAR